MKKYFVCSDVHSFFKEMMVALTENGYDKNDPNHILVICGDLFDRGDESKEMFEFVKSLPEVEAVFKLPAAVAAV